MKQKEIDFFPMKSDLEQKLIDFIKLCQEVERDVGEEIEEAVVNALEECNLKNEVSVDRDER